MNRFSIQVIILLIITICAGIVNADDSGNFGFRAGFGYDFISQEYFLDSLITDSLEAILLKKDYFNDKKGLLYLTYNHKKKGNRVAEIGWEQTPELYRLSGRTHLDFQSKSKIDHFYTDLNFELKNRYQGEIEQGEEYFIGQAKLRYRRKISKYWESSAQFKVERALFDSVGSFAYDYSKYSGTFGLSALTENFNNYYLSLTAEKRLVTDSSDIDYFSFRSNCGYLGSFGNGQLTSDLSFEIRKFNQKDTIDDYSYALFDLKYWYNLSNNSFLNPEFELEFYNFADENSYNRDYFLGKFKAVWGHNFDNIVLSIGPELEILSSKSAPEFDDNYSEIALFGGVDFSLESRVILFIENQLGNRYYRIDSDLFSDYFFERIDLIGNIRVLRSLRFDFIFSAEWEWHKNSDNNNRLYLLSSSLTYSF